jgi:hypothetical protein
MYSQPMARLARELGQGDGCTAGLGLAVDEAAAQGNPS